MAYFRFLVSNAPWLLTGFLLTFSSSYGQTFFISIFAGEIRTAFGLSHGQWGGLYLIGTMVSAGVMLWAGGLADRFRVRMLSGAVLGGLALACLFMAATPSLWTLPVAIFFLRFFGQGMASHTAVVAMGRWFDATRGRALSIASMGFAIGQATLPILFAALLASYHWRTLWIGAAGLALVVIPLLWLLLRNERTPQSIAKSSQSRGMGHRHWSRSELLRHWLFWLTLPLQIGPAAWGTSLFFHQVHLAEIKGFTLVEFLSLFPIFITISIGVNFLSGWLLDRIGTGRLIGLSMAPWAISFLIFGLTGSLEATAIGFAFYGIGIGMQAPIMGAFWPEHFGTEHLGKIKSLIASVMVFGSAIGPGITGWLIDIGVAFTTQLWMLSIYFAIAGVLAGIGAAKARQTLAMPA